MKRFILSQIIIVVVVLPSLPAISDNCPTDLRLLSVAWVIVMISIGRTKAGKKAIRIVYEETIKAERKLFKL